ncbi:hypothetical protein HRbin31_00860 [bacterium HR31]|nr:hypothetical protein HRbin31_00860 [bacterium HR31]
MGPPAGPGAGGHPRDLGRGVRPHRGAGAPAPHHPGVREHPAAGGALSPPAHPAVGRRAGGHPPREPGAPPSARDRAAAEVRAAFRGGGHCVAGARHRHRVRGSRLPRGRPARRRDPAAAGGPVRPRAGPYAEGRAVPPDPGRAGAVCGGHPGGAGGSAGPDPLAPQAAGRSGPAAGRRGRGPALFLGGPLAHGPARLPLPGALAGRVRPGTEDAGGRGGARPRPRRRPAALGPHHGHGARPSRDPDPGPHLRRGDPGDLRLRRGGGAGRETGGPCERGLRGGVPGGRRVPPGEHQLAGPSRGVRRPREGGKRPRCTPHHSLLAGGGARPHRGAVPSGERAAGGGGRARYRPRGCGGVPHGARGSGPAGSRAGGGLPAADPGGAGLRAHAAPCGGGTVLRRRGRHAAGPPRPVRGPDQPGLGAGTAQALLPDLRLRAAGRGHRRRHRPVFGRAAQLPPGGHLRLRAAPHRARGSPAGHPAVASVCHPLAPEREPGPGDPAALGWPSRAAPDPADAGGGPTGRGVSRTGGLPGQPHGPPDPAGPPVGQPDPHGLPRGRPGCGRPGGGGGGRGTRRGPDRGRGHAAAVPHVPRDPEREPLRVLGRRAPGGAARKGGEPAPGGPRAGRGSRSAGSRRHRGGAGSGESRRAGRRRAARPAADGDVPAARASAALGELRLGVGAGGPCGAGGGRGAGRLRGAGAGGCGAGHLAWSPVGPGPRGGGDRTPGRGGTGAGARLDPAQRARYRVGAGGPAPRPCGRRPRGSDGFGGARGRPAGSLHSGCAGGRVVRAAAAGPDPPAHGGAAPAGDRTHEPRGLPAVSAAVAARAPRDSAARPGGAVGGTPAAAGL